MTIEPQPPAAAPLPPPKKKTLSPILIVLLALVGVCALCLVIGLAADTMERVGILPTRTPTLEPTLTPSPTPEPSPTLTPSPTHTPIPDLTATAEAVEQSYSFSAGMLGYMCGESLTTMGEKMGQASAVNLLSETWRSEANAMLDEVESFCIPLGEIEPVPDRLKEVDAELKLFSKEVKTSMDYLRAGVNNIDIYAMSQAVQSMNRANEHLNNATQMMTDLGLLE